MSPGTQGPYGAWGSGGPALSWSVHFRSTRLVSLPAIWRWWFWAHNSQSKAAEVACEKKIRKRFRPFYWWKTRSMYSQSRFLMLSFPGLSLGSCSEGLCTSSSAQACGGLACPQHRPPSDLTFFAPSIATSLTASKAPRPHSGGCAFCSPA